MHMLLNVIYVKMDDGKVFYITDMALEDVEALVMSDKMFVKVAGCIINKNDISGIYEGIVDESILYIISEKDEIIKRRLETLFVAMQDENPGVPVLDLLLAEYNSTYLDTPPIKFRFNG